MGALFPASGRPQIAGDRSRTGCELLAGRRDVAGGNCPRPARSTLAGELMLAELKAAERRHGQVLKVVRALIGAILNPAYADLLRPDSLDLIGTPEGERVVSELTSLLEAGARAGHVRVCDYGAAARVVLGLALWSPIVPPTPLSGAERRRIIEGLQELVTYGCVGDRAERLRDRRPDAGSFWCAEAGGRDTILASASYVLNRRPAVSMAEIAAALEVSADTLRLCFGERDRLVAACHMRSHTIFLQIQDAAILPGPLTAVSVRSLVRETALSYLRRNLQPLGPLVGLGELDAASEAQIRLRWAGLGMLLRTRWIDGVGAGELRERHHQLAPRFWPALCSALACGLWQEEPQDPRLVADSVAEMICVGLAPI